MHIRTDHAAVFADEARHNAVAQQLRRREEDTRKVQRVQETEASARANVEHRSPERRLNARA